MKGTVFAVALNHQSQIEAWRQAFNNPPYKTPPQTPVWFIKPRNTLINSGEGIPFPPGENVFSGGTLALVVGKTAHKISTSQAGEYISGYRLANEISLAETTFYRPAIKAKCRDGFCPLGDIATNVCIQGLEIVTEINGIEKDRWNTADLYHNAAHLLSALSEFATLQPGDCILLGTPQQRVALQPDDEVMISASGFTPLRNQLVILTPQTGAIA